MGLLINDYGFDFFDFFFGGGGSIDVPLDFVVLKSLNGVGVFLGNKEISLRLLI